MTQHPQSIESILRGLDDIVRLIELDNDDGGPLYEDEDRRVGFKEKQLHDYLRTTLTSLLEDIVKECEGMKRNRAKPESSDEAPGFLLDCGYDAAIDTYTTLIRKRIDGV